VAPFIVPLRVLWALLEDEKWTARLEKAESVAEMQKVIEKFCREKSLAYTVVPLK
jgi:hypothetical protein